MSNFPFLAALYPAWHAARRPDLFVRAWEGYAWAGFFTAVAAVTFGSSYYHWEPNDATLVRGRRQLARRGRGGRGVARERVVRSVRSLGAAESSLASTAAPETCPLYTRLAELSARVGLGSEESGWA